MKQLVIVVIVSAAVVSSAFRSKQRDCTLLQSGVIPQGVTIERVQ